MPLHYYSREVHTLHYYLTLDASRAKIFEIFVDAANLGIITDPELDFAILPAAVHKLELPMYPET